MKTIVLTNLSSSSSTDISAPLQSIFDRYGYEPPTILVGQSGDMGEMLTQMRAAKGDLLIAYGGDGTAAAVAAIGREQKVPFLALPGGTMNMLMHGLYGSDVWDTCLMSGLACAKARPMASGLVQDSQGQTGTFLVGAIFGQPTKMNEAREELRNGQVMEAAKGAVDAMFTKAKASQLSINAQDHDFQDRRFDLINVTCPFMDGDALDPDRLDVTLIETISGGNAVSLGWSAIRGSLKQNNAVDGFKTTSFKLAADKTIDALLDGEPFVFEGDVTVTIDTHHNLVLAPWPAMSSHPPQDR